MKKAKGKEAAEKPAKKAPAKAAAPKTVTKKAASKPAAKKAVTKTAVAAPAATTSAVAPPAKKPAAKKAVKKSVNVTTVVAGIDVGFGNKLFIRGEGPGLSWDQGVLMDCKSSDSWVWSTKAASRAFPYKLLINDQQWSIGEDHVANAGQQNAVVPAF